VRDRMRYLSSLHGSAVAWGGEAVFVLVIRGCRPLRMREFVSLCE